MSLFTAGLVDSLQRAVEFYRPGNLKVAMALVQTFERKRHFVAVQSSQGTANLEFTTWPITAAPSHAGRNNRSITTPTPALPHGLLPHGPSSTEKSTKGSLCTINGLPCSQTVQLLADCNAWLLIDSDSTANFLCHLMILQLGVLVRERPGFFDTVANKDIINIKWLKHLLGQIMWHSGSTIVLKDLNILRQLILTLSLKKNSKRKREVMLHMQGSSDKTKTANLI